MFDRPVLISCLLALLCAVGCGTAPEPELSASGDAQARRPNIVLIQADDLGYGDIGPYGQRRFETPNLDRLAAGGTRFTQYYAGSTVCAPSRYSLMTGLHTGHAAVRGNGEYPLRAEDITVAKLLQAAGYRTAVIGKWGLGLPGSTGLPHLQGFDYFFGYLDHRHAHRHYTNYLYRGEERIDVDPAHFTSDLFTEEAKAFIRSARGGPFFLYLNYPIPHAELLVPEDSLAPFRGRFDETAFVNPKADANPFPEPGPSGGYRSQPTPRAAFAGMVTRLDRYVGELVALLDAEGLTESTLVLFTSDNGPHREGGADPAFFGSSGPLRGMKRDLYEGGIRVPMIVRWRGRVPAGRVSHAPWWFADFLPTAAALGGAAAPPNLDGIDVTPLLLGGDSAGARTFYWEFHEGGFRQAVREGTWKAVRLNAGRPIELYDLESDPGERRDVASEHPEVVRRMNELMSELRSDSPDWPVRTSRD